jgi:ATP-dependent RNA helicase RhlE
MSNYAYKSSKPGASRRPTRAYHARPARAQNGRGPKKNYIHPSQFVKAAKPVVLEEVVPPTNQFSDFAVVPLIQANLRRKGLTTPSPIQDQAIPVGLTGQDVIGIANTGTGKTIAFALPVLQRLFTDPQAQALIMAPTRELAEQIQEECRSLVQGSKLYSALLIGGASIGAQLRDLRRNPTIVIGTPGRIKDHVERKSINLASFNMVVLDEVDRMLDMGFVNDMRDILGRLHQKRQSFFFSATLDDKVRKLINEFSSDPATISVKTGDTSDYVEQAIINYLSKEDKISKLHDLLIDSASVKTLVFDDTKRSVERLSKELIARGFKADAIHGGKTQGQRKRALEKFKKNDIDVLVATDVAARGIDISDISHVINYSEPQTYEDYVHRIGRAGRAGRTGNALTFVGHTGAK